MATLTYPEKLAKMTELQKEIKKAVEANDLKKYREILDEGKTAVGIRPAYRVLVDGKPVEENIKDFGN